MKPVILVAAIFVFPVLVGCAGVRPAVHTFDNKVTSPYSFEAVWSATIETLAERNIPIATMEKASGFVATQQVVFPQDCADCGETPVGIKSGDVQGSFNVFVKAVDDQHSSVMITAQFKSVIPNSYWATCNSTGKFEQLFLQNLIRKLDSVATPAGGTSIR